MTKLLNKRIFESKQVGKIYHFCALKDVEKYIAPTDTLSPSGLFWNRLTKSRNTISFTRNPNFRLNTLRSYNITVRFTVDGNKLSNNYKIIPYSAYGVSSPHFKSDYISEEPDYDSDEMEEIVVGKIKNFHKYILSIKISVKDQNFTKEDLLEDNGFQILLNYITKYNIPRDNIEVKLHGKTYKLNKILIPNIDDIEYVFSDIKNGKSSIIKLLDYDSLFHLFYKIIHELEYDYPYDLVVNVDEFKNNLSSQDIKKCRNVFIDIMKIINEDELNDFIDFMDSLNFGS